MCQPVPSSWNSSASMPGLSYRCYCVLRLCNSYKACTCVSLVRPHAGQSLTKHWSRLEADWRWKGSQTQSARFETARALVNDLVRYCRCSAGQSVWITKQTCIIGWHASRSQNFERREWGCSVWRWASWSLSDRKFCRAFRWTAHPYYRLITTWIW